jgi:hypothetical protein
MAGQGAGLVADTLHQTAITGDDPGAVVHQALAKFRGQQALGNRHTNGGGQALAERAGGHFNRRVLAIFRVPGGGAVQLAEIAQRLHIHAGMAGEVQQRVQQHGAMAGGEHETVAVRPVRVGGVKLHMAGPEHGGGIGHAERHARVAAFGGLHGVNRQRADGVGHDALLARGLRQNHRLAEQNRLIVRIIRQTRHVLLFHPNAAVHKARRDIAQLEGTHAGNDQPAYQW